MPQVFIGLSFQSLPRLQLIRMYAPAGTQELAGTPETDIRGFFSFLNAAEVVVTWIR